MGRPKDEKAIRKAIAYVPPILFCALLIAFAWIRNHETDAPIKAVLQQSEPLTLTQQAIENYLCGAGFTLQEGLVLDGDGQTAGTLAVTEDGAIQEMALAFSLPPHIQVAQGEEVFAALNAAHDQAAQQGEDMFLSLFDAIAATDGRVAARRESALDKLKNTIETGKPSTQAANSWRITFSLAPGEPDSRVTILFTLVK